MTIQRLDTPFIYGSTNNRILGVRNSDQSVGYFQFGPSSLGYAPVVYRTTWELRPASANDGDELFATNVGPSGSKFHWLNGRWVSSSPQVLYHDYVAKPAHTGTLTTTTIATFQVPANLLGGNGLLEIDFESTANNTANAKRWNVNFGGTDLFHLGPSGSTFVGGRCKVKNLGVTNSQSGTPLNLASTLTFGVNNQLTASVDTTTAVTVNINATLSNIGDTMTLSGFAAFFTSIA